MRYQGDGAIFNPDNYRNFYGLEGGGHGDGEVNGGAIVHQFNFKVDDEEVVGFQDEIFLCFISFGGLPITGKRAVDIHLHIDTILFAEINWCLNAEGNSFRIPVSYDKLPAFGSLISQIPKIDVLNVTAFVFLVIKQTLQGVIIYNNFNGHDDVSIELEKNNVFLRGEGNLCWSDVDERELLY